MDDLNLYLTLITFGAASIVWAYNYYYKKKGMSVSLQLANTTVILVVVILLSISFILSYYAHEPIDQDIINQFTVLSLIFALISIASNTLTEVTANKPFEWLNSEIRTVHEEITNLANQNTQEVITQIKQLEESQKALADQVQSLKDHLLKSDPSELHDDEDLTGSLADKRD